MSKLEDAEIVVAELSPAEKASLVQSVTRELGNATPGIEAKPGVCGGEACIARMRIPVWVLERARQLGTSVADLLRAYLTRRAADLVNAWSYVNQHREEIDRQIQDNADAAERKACQSRL